MIAGVMRLGDRPVRAIMTPRREVDMLDLTADPDDIRRTIVESVHSRLPARAGTPEEMLGIALEAKPDAVTLVAENPNEITTEGGLDAKANIAIVRATVSKLRLGNILASLFIDPDPVQIEAAHDVGAQQVELCTAAYAEATLGAHGIHGEGAAHAAHELRRLREAAELAMQYGLNVAAGHGLTYRNVGAVAEIKQITEFNIGHNIVARAIFVGLENAVREMIRAIRD